MKYLIDTHIIIWSLTDPKKISAGVRKVLVDERNDIFFSPISLWEISIKFSLGKLDLGGLEPQVILEKLSSSFIECHPPSPHTSASIHQLSRVHNDPFDRLLVWSCIQDDITMISSDKQLGGYGEHGLKIQLNE
ncbi:MAG: type II toxin-antitoxin system VapC family toxin [Propionibacteriaceae bacterium]|jgi:PIN domain nuclease of toxin-antitoxin system|nr:type II toxin-antitoxin system VapC family toxin [Propionibacteriaceae bacterium]